jgi:hypothetical protein
VTHLLNNLVSVFTLSYLQIFIFPAVLPMALLAEWCVFRVVFRNLSTKRLLITLAVTNLVSFVVGIAEGCALQAGIFRLFGYPPLMFINSIAYSSFAFQLFCSLPVEYFMWKWSLRYLRPPFLIRTVSIAVTLRCAVIALTFYGIQYAGRM